MRGQIVNWEYDNSLTEYENFRRWFDSANEERRNFKEPELSLHEAKVKYEEYMGIKLNFEEGFNE